MAIQIQLRQGTTTEHNTFTGAVGELTYDTEKKQLRVHDGTTVGGKIVDDPTRDVTSQVSAATETTAGKAKIATTAIAQAGTNDTDFLTAKKLRVALNASGVAPIYACRAWVNFNGTGTVTIRASGNVSSITDNGVGDYTVNFMSSMPDNNYAVSYSASTVGGGQHAVRLLNLSTNSVNVHQTQDNSNAYPSSDAEIVTVAIFR